MNIQALFDGLSAEWQRERAETQMTLGQLIEILESMPADTEIRGLNCPHSYRGYYYDLAFEPTEGTVMERLKRLMMKNDGDLNH